MTYWAAETSTAAERWPDPALVREGLLLFEEADYCRGYIQNWLQDGMIPERSATTHICGSRQDLEGGH
jgi:hypothetical protein